MKKKTIWFINKDAAPIEFYGTHLRTIKLAQYFQSEGYNVKLFCSSYVHNRNLCLSDSNKTFEEKTYDNIPFVLVNAGCGSTNGIRRIISYFRFAVKLFIHRKQFEKPDVIIHTSRIPFDIPPCNGFRRRDRRGHRLRRMFRKVHRVRSAAVRRPDRRQFP